MRVRTARNRLTRQAPYAIAGLLALAGLLTPARAKDPPPPLPLAARPFIIAMGPVDGSAATPADAAALIAVQEDLPRRLARAASELQPVIPYLTFRLAATTLPGTPSVAQGGEAKTAAAALGYDRLVLVTVRSAEQSLSAHWQVYDPSAGGGTLAAGRLPGHPADLTGFVAALTQRVGDALGCFEATRLRKATLQTLTGWSQAYTDYYTARALADNGSPEQAISLLEAAVRLDPAFREAKAYDALLSLPTFQRLLEQQDFPTLVASVREARTALEGWAPEARVELLRIAQDACLRGGAPAEFRSAGLEYVQALIDTGDGGHALRVLPSLLTDAVEDPTLAVLRSRAHRALGDWKAAEDALKLASLDWPRDAAIRAEQGRLYLAWADRVDPLAPDAPAQRLQWVGYAKLMFAKASDLDRRDPTYRALLGLAEFAAGASGPAEKHLDSALRTSAKLQPTDRIAAATTLARIRVARRDPRRATMLLAEATSEALSLPFGPLQGARAAPSPASPWSDIAVGWEALGDHDRAMYSLALLKAYYGLPHGVLALQKQLTPAPELAAPGA